MWKGAVLIDQPLFAYIPILHVFGRSVAELKANGVNVLDGIETFGYGKFVHLLDPEGNKIELWEPVDQVFAEMHEGKTTK